MPLTLSYFGKICSPLELGSVLNSIYSYPAGHRSTYPFPFSSLCTIYTKRERDVYHDVAIHIDNKWTPHFKFLLHRLQGNN